MIQKEINSQRKIIGSRQLRQKSFDVVGLLQMAGKHDNPEINKRTDAKFGVKLVEFEMAPPKEILKARQIASEV